MRAKRKIIKKRKIDIIIWSIEAEKFDSLGISFQQLHTNIKNSTILFEWEIKKGGRKRKVSGDGVSIEDAPKFFTINMKTHDANVAIGEDNAIPLRDRIEIINVSGEKGTYRATSDIRVGIDKRKLSFDIPAIKFKSSGLIKELTEGKEFEMFNPAEIKDWSKWNISILTENQLLGDDGRYEPAFQEAKAEKHHFQINKNINGPENFDKLIRELNNEIDIYNSKLKEIPDKWKNHMEQTGYIY